MIRSMPYALALLLATTSAAADAGEPAEGRYRRPPAAVERLLTAPSPPTPVVHASSRRIALLYREKLLPLERVARPFVGLAGYRFDPVTRTSGISQRVRRVEVISADPEVASAPVATWAPEDGALLDHVRFSPDGRRLSALAVRDGPARLAIFDIATGAERRLEVPVQAAWGDPCAWTAADALLCRVVPEDRGDAPAREIVPIGVEHDGGPEPVRTYTNVLRDVSDDALFEHWFASELARVDLAGNVHRLPATRGLLESVEPSPDGAFAVVSRITGPFPRLVRAGAFPSVIEIWTLDEGTRRYASRPAGFGVEAEEGDDDEPSPRRFAWRPGSPPTIGWVEPSAASDAWRWMALEGPSPGTPVQVVESARRIRRFGWTTAGTPYFSTRRADGTGVAVYVVIDGGAREIWSGDSSDRYGDPGDALRVDGDDGPVLEVDGRIFLAGDGLGPEGPSPFLASYDLESGEARPLFRSEPGAFETVLALLDAEAPTFLTSHETETSAPRLAVRSGTTRRWLTPEVHPYPELERTERRRLAYERADGVKMTATLYLPSGRAPDERLPTLIWIYPREFDDAELAEQIDVRSYRFHHVVGVSPLAAVLRGYAVVVFPTVPILTGEASADLGFVPQLVASVEAAARHLVEIGVAHPDRIAVGGHSYGAFSSLNLAAHSRKIATAVAMSGAYNRTLTPFGFQHEKRSLWEAAEMYTHISPFFRVDQIEIPVLLVHGGADPNPGTPPMQSRRLFHAMVGEGVHARYVELPFEEHHYRARENVLHASAEELDWLDRTIGPRATP